MKEKIPIFPLNLVVFPKSMYPLHIFEERYKRLIARCTDEKTGFGIVANVNKKLSNIGCYVTVEDILKKYPSGELDIVVKGEERFTILSTEKHEDGYLEAKVKPYDDNELGIDFNLVEEMKFKFTEILDKVHFQLEDSFWENYKNTDMKSFKLAEKSGLPIEQQQTLLSFKDENTRMAFLIEHFEKLDKKINETTVLKSIIMSDGYLNK